MSPTVHTVLAAVAGAVLVPLAADGDGTGLALLGAVLGAVGAAWWGDRARLRALSDRVAALEQRQGAGPVVAPELRVPTPGDGGSVPVVRPAASGPTAPGAAARDPAASGPRPAAGPARTPRPARRPAWSLDRFPPEVRRAWDFVTGGNPIIRVGVLVGFVGIGLGIRQAAEVGYLPIAARLALAAVVGVGLIGLGWRLRRGTPGFGLTVQGGGVAVLYLTVYAAYALYGLVPSLAAIGLMAAVALACGALAVVQDAPGLAVLGVAGGFAAPVLAGTAEGNHVLLLAYYALLNLGVLGVAWGKGWRSVAVVGFVSTFVTGGLWGGLQYRPALYATVQPFVVLSFAVYLALAVRFALRSARSAPPERALAVDGALVFGLPAATFVLQAGLVEGVVPYGRAWSAVVLAGVYLAGAAALRRRASPAASGPDAATVGPAASGPVTPASGPGGVRLLADAFLAVGLTFATLALPLAFQRVVFGAMWVLEGAGLVWVGARQRKPWMRAAGVVLQGAAAAVLFAEGVLSPSDTFTAESLTGWIVAVGLGLSAYVLRDAPDAPETGRPLAAPPAEPLALAVSPALPPVDASPPAASGRWLRPATERAASRALLGFALFWWTVTAGVHVLDLAPDRHVLAAMLGAAAASGALFLGLGRALRWGGLAAASFGAVPAGWLLWALALLDGASPTAGARGLGWVAVLGVAGASLAAVRAHPLRRPAFVGAAWLAVAVVAFALGDGVGRATEGAWALGAVGAVLVAGLALATRVPASFADEGERWPAVAGLAAAVAVWVVVGWSSPGDAPPLPPLPVLNPVGLPTVGALLALLAVRHAAPDRTRGALAVLVGGLGFGSLSVAVLRAAHGWGGVPWAEDALWASGTAQAGLAVAWTVLALALAVVAVRRGSRPLWFFGAAVLAVVVGKLFLVDLSQAQALVRIGAFLTVGALMLLIGYRAPLPPAPDAADAGP